METRMASHVLMSELTRISAQQDQLKAAIAEAMSEADTTGEPFRISPLGLKSFKLHDKELEAQVDEDEEWEPSSPGIQAGWVEPDSTPQAEEAPVRQLPEGAETPSKSLDLPRESFAQLVQKQAAAAFDNFQLTETPPAAPLPQLAPAPPPSVEPVAKAINYGLINQPEVAESREALRAMKAALSTQVDSSPAIASHYGLGLTEDHRTEQQQALDTIKLQDTRLKEAFLLSKEAHYQQEQQRLNRLNEAQESEAITKLLLQAKLAPTPMTAALLAKEREKERKKAEKWQQQQQKEASKQKKKEEERQRAEEKAAAKDRRQQDEQHRAQAEDAERRRQKAAADQLAEDKRKQKQEADRQLQQQYQDAMEKKEVEDAEKAKAQDVYAELQRLKAENQQLKKDITVYEENRLLKEENKGLKAENAQLKGSARPE